MTHSELTYGSAERVSNYLMMANDVNHEEILSALINALEKIDNLEKKVDRLNEHIQKVLK